ncbi:TetR family transcriptional regulator [Pseudonocardia petroleophila]|uniref:TetR family transcriptional regulator n=1 Tax=Pseudonocardia petroleophila TaxID=37331 RepID=A0A7G7MET0_9PSEU|nr:TetR family transcriptional regulator [Pseudonocardia petroleophila]QNG51291.1 TetR family transcriptional regulator [Pseudonocardia petroleophila]
MSRGPNDPGRRDRIVAAAGDLMGRDGLHTITHRAVAAHAGVPLGSTTYYFRDLDDLLLAAVDVALEQSRGRIAAWDAALPPDAPAERVCRSLAEMTVGYLTEHTARTVLDYELYAAGLRREPLRARSAEWIGLLRTALRGRFDPLTADALTAAVDGFTLQALLARGTPTVEECEGLLRRVVAG